MLADLYRSAVVFLVVLVFAAAGMGYCAGRVEGRKSVRLEQNEQRIHVATTHRAAAEAAAMKAIERSTQARQERRVIRERIQVVDDTTLTLDDLPLTVPLPVVQLIQKSDQLARTDSITIVLLQRQVTTLEEERDAWKERAELLEPPRLNFTDGVIAGGTATAAAALALTGNLPAAAVVAGAGGVVILVRAIF